MTYHQVFPSVADQTVVYVILVEGDSFKFKNGPLFKVKTNMDCSSKNLLYVIQSKGCEENYTGQTGNNLRK